MSAQIPVALPVNLDSVESVAFSVLSKELGDSVRGMHQISATLGVTVDCHPMKRRC